MKKVFFTLLFGLILNIPLKTMGQPSDNGLPESGIKSPYSPLAIPTILQPVDKSMANLMRQQGYSVVTTSSYGDSGLIFTLKRNKDVVLCILNPPSSAPGSDQTVPTSRCWKLD